MANQKLISLEQDERIEAAAARLSMDRREFLQFCAAMATTLGLPQGADAAVAEAVATKKRPSVIWLHFQECTGCTESILRAEHPTLDKLILDVISLDYHETLFAAAGRHRRGDPGEEEEPKPHEAEGGADGERLVDLLEDDRHGGEADRRPAHEHKGKE